LLTASEKNSVDKHAKVILLGVGSCALALVDFYRDKIDAGRIALYGTTRSAEKLPVLASLGIQPLLDSNSDLLASDDLSEANARDVQFIEQLRNLAKDAFILVSYPPPRDGAKNLSDMRYGAALSQAKKIVYISSTAVYGSASGVINEDTPTSSEGQYAPRLSSEKFWQKRGACVLRAPGLYSPQTGLHKLLLSGKYKLPGDGSNYVSRIHLDDLAVIIDAAFQRAECGSLFVVGDERPATHIEVVSWLCQKLDLPMPPAVPIEDVHLTLRGNRQIDSSRVLRQLHVGLQYPSYVEGLSQCLAVASAQ